MIFPSNSIAEYNIAAEASQETKNHVATLAGRPIKKVKPKKKHACTHDGCGKSFAHLRTLKVHSRIHSDSNPFKCTICNKPCFSSNNLKIHSRAHSNARPFPCNICNKNYKSSESLKTHTRTHKNERKYKCHICKASFNLSKLLVQHNKCDTHKRKVEIAMQNQDPNNSIVNPYDDSLAPPPAKIAKPASNTRENTNLDNHGIQDPHLDLPTQDKPSDSNPQQQPAKLENKQAKPCLKRLHPSNGNASAISPTSSESLPTKIYRLELGNQLNNNLQNNQLKDNTLGTEHKPTTKLFRPWEVSTETVRSELKHDNTASLSDLDEDDLEVARILSPLEK